MTGDRAALAGESKNTSVPQEGVWSVRVAINQVGEAQSPARAHVRWSLNGNEFHDVPDGQFVAGTETGIYTTKPVIAVPDDARYVRIAFDPQVGGTHSVIEAYLVTGAPSIGEIFRNLVLMLFTNPC